jgi:hypothetical protein
MYCEKHNTFSIVLSDRKKVNVLVSVLSEFLTKDPEIRVQFPALPDFLRSSRSGTGSTQPREYN